MITEKTGKTTAMKGPVVRKTRIFPILGAALLVTCLFAGFAQATVGDCGNHSIRCLDKDMNVLGEINNAPCYYRITSCEDNPVTDFSRCESRYPATRYMQRTSTCSY